MKRLISAVLCIAMMLCLVACGKSAAAKEADALILAIGEVTPDSEDAIQAAEDAVAALTESEVDSLDNLPTLRAARAKYQLLVAQNAVTALGDTALTCLDYLDFVYETLGEIDSPAAALSAVYAILLRGFEPEDLMQAAIEQGLVSQETAENGSWNEILSELFQNSGDAIKLVYTLFSSEGYFDDAAEALEKVKESLSELDTDSNYFSGLLDYFNLVNSMYSFGKELPVSLSDLGDMISDFRNELTRMKSELDEILE